MKVTRVKVRTALLIFAEAFLVFGGVIAAAYLRLGTAGTESELLEDYGFQKALLATVVCLGAFYLFDLYDFVVMHDRRELVLRLVQALGLSWVLLAGIFYMVPRLMMGRGILLIALPLALILMVGWRVSIHWLFGHPRFGERVLIIGAGETAVEVARAVLQRPDAGFRVAGFVDNRPEMVGKSLINPRVLGTLEQLPALVSEGKIDRIIVAMNERRGHFPTDELLRLSLSGDVAIEECTSFFERLTGRVDLNTVRPSWLIFSGRKRQAPLSGILRATLHRFVALIGAVLSAPLAALTALAIRLDSPGPILYRQERVGQHGQSFMLYKFRSMRADAEKNGPVWASNSDDRVTRVGRVIRKIRFDEIPQFWNILRGEMSFIGPRPERPHFVAQLAREIPFYEQRHLIAPGLTGWAQINYPYGASIEDARRKLEYDLYYIKNQSLTLDAVVMFETIKTVLFGRGAR